MATKTAVKPTSVVTLRGSAQIVAEFFGYSINSILYQRGLFDPEAFKVVKKYGLQMQILTDEGVSTYLKQALKQICEWLMQGKVKKLVLVIEDQATSEPLERWEFNVSTDEEVVETGATREKNPADIQKEIAAIIRQITASQTYLPLLESSCTFDLIVYTKDDADTPAEWEESSPKLITARSNEVRLRSFSTRVHSVSTSVTYKVTDDEE